MRLQYFGIGLRAERRSQQYEQSDSTAECHVSSRRKGALVSRAGGRKVSRDIVHGWRQHGQDGNSGRREFGDRRGIRGQGIRGNSGTDGTFPNSLSLSSTRVL